MNNILEYISNNYNYFYEISKNITKNKNPDDLLNSIILYINDIYKKDAFIKSFEKGYLDFLIIKMLKLEYTSKTSYYYRQNKKYDKLKSSNLIKEKIDSFDIYKKMEVDNFKDIINKTLKEICAENDIKYWELECWKLYHLYERQSYREIEKEINVSLTSVFNGIKKVNTLFEKKIKEKYEKYENI
jgi:hypothetical protein